MSVSGSISGRGEHLECLITNCSSNIWIFWCAFPHLIGPLVVFLAEIGGGNLVECYLVPCMIESKHVLSVCILGGLGCSRVQPYTARYHFCHRMRCGPCCGSLMNWFLSTAVCECACVQGKGERAAKFMCN